MWLVFDDKSMAETEVEKRSRWSRLRMYSLTSMLGTTQACLFRDSYAPITGASFAVYGLSTDSGKANTTFVNKNSLPYPLLVSSILSTKSHSHS